MSGNTAFILPRNSLQLETPFRTARRNRPLFLWLLVLLAASLPAWGATATTTTLTTGSKTVNSRTITTLKATVSPTTLTQGLVQFKDGKVLLGTAQIVKTGTKFTHGAAYLSVELGPGTHSITAVFAGTAAYAASTSAAASVVIAGGTTSTTISSTGAAGNYTLTGQVIANGAAPVTGNINFIDQTASNATIGTVPLGTATAKRTYAAFSAIPIYNPNADTNPSPQQVVIADLNGDGILDIVDLDYDTMVGVHMGNGNGTFQTAKSYCMDTTNGSEVRKKREDENYDPAPLHSLLTTLRDLDAASWQPAAWQDSKNRSLFPGQTLKEAWLRAEDVLGRLLAVPTITAYGGTTGSFERWVLDWRQADQQTHLELHPALALVEIFTTGRLSALKQCEQCEKWICARFPHQRFCPGGKCQQQFHKFNETDKERRRKWARENYQSRKELELGSRKAAQRRGGKK